MSDPTLSDTDFKNKRESGLPLKIMFSTQSIFANPLFGISTRMDPSFSHKSSLESEKVEKNENLVAFLVGLVSGYANICSNGGLIILKLMLKLLMRRISQMHHYPMRSFNYTFWAGKKLKFNHH